MSETRQLNDAVVKALPVPAKGNKTHPFAGARLGGIEAPRGFGVKVFAGGARAFTLDYYHERRERQYTIGKYPDWTAQAAVREARAVRRRVDKGEDPLDARHANRGALTFDNLIDEWNTLYLAQRRPRYAAEATRAIRNAFPRLLKRPADAITRPDVVNVLDKLVASGKVAMAGRTMAYGRAAFTWGMKRGKVTSNPFQGLPIQAGTSARDRVLDDGEIRAAWEAAGTLGYPWGPFFRLAMLTMQRRENVAGATWGEFDLERRLWTIPGSRMKNGKPHDVHLSRAALDVLAGIPHLAGSDLVFTTTGKTPISGFSKAKAQLDKAIAEARGTALDAWVVHDLRRSGVSTLARLGFDSIVVDKLLAHQPAKLLGVAAVYQRHDFARERAAALDAWAAHVTGQGGDGNVVALRAG